MSLTPEDRDRLTHLLDALCDGSSENRNLREADLTWLRTLLLQHEEARVAYLDAMWFTGTTDWLLRQEAGEMAVANLSGTNAGSRQQRTQPQIPRQTPVLGLLGRAVSVVQRPLAWSILAVGLVFGCYFAILAWDLRGPVARVAAPHERPTIAAITGTHAPQWAADSQPVASSGKVHTGEELTLDSGMVTLTLELGSVLTIEGPARWSIGGDNRARLAYGKLLARVPPAAVGFVLETPSAQVIDLSTDFGVEVEADGSARVHVLQGQVDVLASTPQPVAKRLVAGEGARVVPGGQVRPVTGQADTTFRELVRFQKQSAPGGAPASPALRLMKLPPNAVATQSSTYIAYFHAGFALDGSLDTFSHTGVGDPQPHWRLDLGEVRSIAGVLMYNRTNKVPGRLRDVVVSVLAADGETVVAKSPLLNPGNEKWGGASNLDSGPPQLMFNIFQATGGPALGRYVVIERIPDEHDDCEENAGIQSYLTLAEVQLFEMGPAQPAESQSPASK